MNTNVLDRVCHVVADLFTLPLEQVTATTSPKQITAWDSLQQLNLILALEHDFEVQLSPEEIETIKSVETAAQVLEHKLANAQ